MKKKEIIVESVCALIHESLITHVLRIRINLKKSI